MNGACLLVFNGALFSSAQYFCFRFFLYFWAGGIIKMQRLRTLGPKGKERY